MLEISTIPRPLGHVVLNDGEDWCERFKYRRANEAGVLRQATACIADACSVRNEMEGTAKDPFSGAKLKMHASASAAAWEARGIATKLNPCNQFFLFDHSGQSCFDKFCLS